VAGSLKHYPAGCCCWWTSLCSGSQSYFIFEGPGSNLSHNVIRVIKSMMKFVGRVVRMKK